MTRPPFIVAHRAGNDAPSLRRAEAAGAAVVEADLRLFRGQVEVRHLKSIGPLPLFWDEWRLAPPWMRRMQLPWLLRAAAANTRLMLDLKGNDLRLSRLVRAALAEAGRSGVSVCSRSWRLLEPFGDDPDVQVVHSVGSGRQLRALLERGAADGVSIHKRLLDARLVAKLRRMTPVILTWPVVDQAEAERLVGWGIDGLITERYELIRAS